MNSPCSARARAVVRELAFLGLVTSNGLPASAEVKPAAFAPRPGHATIPGADDVTSPDMTWPTLISIFRIVLIVPLTLTLLAAYDDVNRRWALAICFVMGVSDFFDGW